MWCCLVLLAVVVSGPHQARASAWNAPQGQGLVAVDYTFAGGAHYFNDQGQLSPAAAYRKQELYGYLEYGVTDWLMAIVKPDLTAISAVAADGQRTHYDGVGTSDAAAQLRLAVFGPAVLAVAAGFRMPGPQDKENPALIGNTSRDADFRVLGGTALPFGPVPVFAELQVAYRLRSGGNAAEWHVDATLGSRPWPRLLVLLQSFTTIPEGPGSLPYPPALYSKLQIGLVYDLTSAWSVEVGAFETVGGRDALRERGVKTGLWYRF